MKGRCQVSTSSEFWKHFFSSYLAELQQNFRGRHFEILHPIFFSMLAVSFLFLRSGFYKLPTRIRHG